MYKSCMLLTVCQLPQCKSFRSVSQCQLVKWGGCCTHYCVAHSASCEDVYLVFHTTMYSTALQLYRQRPLDESDDALVCYFMMRLCTLAIAWSTTVWWWCEGPWNMHLAWRSRSPRVAHWNRFLAYNACMHVCASTHWGSSSVHNYTDAFQHCNPLAPIQRSATERNHNDLVGTLRVPGNSEI